MFLKGEDKHKNMIKWERSNLNPMIQNKSLDNILQTINSLPGEKKEALFKKIRATLTLGLRALILKELNSNDKEEFEKIILEKGDDKLFLFGDAHIDNFNDKF